MRARCSCQSSVDRPERRFVKVDSRRGNVVAELFGTGRADDRARDVRLAQDPRQRELRHREPQAVRNRAQSLNALEHALRRDTRDQRGYYDGRVWRPRD